MNTINLDQDIINMYLYIKSKMQVVLHVLLLY